jgi:hypothetical protein
MTAVQPSYIDVFRRSLARLGMMVLLCWLMAGTVFAQQGPAVSAAVDSAAIRIGEQFHLKLEASGMGRGGLIWAEIPDTFNHLQVVARGPVDTLADADKILYRQDITLTGFDSGAWEIPAWTFTILSSDSARNDTLRTQPLSVQVQTVPVDTTKPFRPIKQVRSVPFNLLAYWPYMAGGLVLIALVIVYWLFFRKRKKAAGEAPEIPLDPPYEEAVKSLKKLEREQLWQHQQIKVYYTRLTDILRRYIERQFGIYAMEQTTEELLDAAKGVTRLNQQQNNLKYILQTADLAKFAKVLPLPEAHEASLKKAYEVLEWTRPQEEAGKAGDESPEKPRSK